MIGGYIGLAIGEPLVVPAETVTRGGFYPTPEEIAAVRRWQRVSDYLAIRRQRRQRRLWQDVEATLRRTLLGVPDEILEAVAAEEAAAAPEPAAIPQVMPADPAILQRQMAIAQMLAGPQVDPMQAQREAMARDEEDVEILLLMM